MRVNFADKIVGGFNYELVRGISIQQAGAAELGECVETMRRVRRGDFDSWTRARSALAARAVRRPLRPVRRQSAVQAAATLLTVIHQL